MGVKLTTLAYPRQAGRTLMLCKNDPSTADGAGRWNGLGGKFEAGEGPEDCLRREVLEESGLRVETAIYKGLLTFPEFDGRDDWYVFVYLVTRFSGTPRASAEGSLHWIADDDVARLPLWPGDRVFLPWLDAPETFSATFRYEQKAFVGYEAVFYGPGGVPARRERGP